jgi:hypothetical protein
MGQHSENLDAGVTAGRLRQFTQQLIIKKVLIFLAGNLAENLGCSHMKLV